MVRSHIKSRRDTLKALGSVGVLTTTGLAGCLGDDDDDDAPTDDDPPGDDDPADDPPSDDDPDPVEIPSDFALAEPSPVYAGFAIPEWTNFSDKVQERHGASVDDVAMTGYVPISGAMLQEDVLMGTLSIPALVSSVNEGLPFRVISTRPMQLYNTVVVQPGLDWEDLDGGEITVHGPLTSSEAATRMMVEAELGAADSVEYDHMFGSTTRLASLEAGEVDAVEAFFGAAITAEEQGFGEILAQGWEYDDGADLPGSYWAVLEPILEDNLEMYGEIISMLQESFVEMYEEDPAEMAQRVVDSPASFPEFDTAVVERQFSTLQEIDMWAHDYEASLSADRLEAALDYNVRFGMIDEEARVEPEDVIDRRLEEYVD